MPGTTTGTTTGSAASVLARVDRAAFATALGTRLRRAGVPVELSRLASFVAALDAVTMPSRGELYWSARISLVRHQRELEAFDQVFAAVFADTMLAMDPHARRQGGTQPPPGTDESWAQPPGAREARTDQQGDGLPWVTRPSVRASDDDPDEDTGTLLAEPLPSAVASIADTPFDALDPSQLRLLTGWLETAMANWPTRRTRRTRPHRRGRRIDLRATLSRGRSTGWEPMHLVRQHPVRAHRRVILLCDVSRSMQPYTDVYLHLMRAAALTVQAEVFAFSTELTRLTPALSEHGSRTRGSAIEKAAARAIGGAGGTRIGYSLRCFLASRHGSAARGAIVIIASDGWDADDPADLDAAMSRLHRRARQLIWLNPRCAEAGFAPLTGAMAAALPYCGEVLPGHTLRAMQDVVDAITRVR